MNANMPKRHQARYLSIGSIGLCLLLSAPSLMGTLRLHSEGNPMNKPVEASQPERLKNWLEPPPPTSYSDTALIEVVIFPKKEKNNPEIIWDEDDPFQPVAPIPEFIEEEHSVEDVRTCELGGVAWHDLDYNGIREAGDPTLSGVKVQLQSHNGDVIATTHSDADGRYHFKGVQAGDYQISFDPGGSGLDYGTQPNQTGGLLSDSKDSDIGTYSYKTPAFHVDMGETLQNINGGFVSEPLVAELSDFRLAEESDGVSIAWLTKSERNARHFEVERSLDGERFESVKQLPAAGFSLKTRAYGWIDASAEVGVLYYRIKQMDLSGRYHYSKTLSIKKSPPPPAEPKRMGRENMEKLLGMAFPKEKGYCVK